MILYDTIRFIKIYTIFYLYHLRVYILLYIQTLAKNIYTNIYKIFIKIDYIFIMSSKKNIYKFKYIDEGQLTKIFGFCQPSLDISYNIHLCIYSFDNCYIEGESIGITTENIDESDNIANQLDNYNMYYPYIKYIVKKKEEGHYDFPSFSYKCPIINSIHEDNNEPSQNIDNNNLDKSPEQIHFETETFQFLLSHFQDDNTIHIKNISIDNIYKGYVEYTETELFIFYDVTTFIKSLKSEYNECLMDEIIYKKKIYNTPIHPTIVDFFRNNIEFTTIRTDTGFHLPQPFQLYMCSYKENTYGSVLQTQTRIQVGGEYINLNPEEMNTQSTSNSIFSSNSFQNKKEIIDQLLEPLNPVVHDVFGPCYIFTNELIHENEIVDRIPVFIVNCFYITEIINEMTEDEKVNLRKKLIKSCSVYYHENNLQLWGIRNISHIGNVIR